MPDLTQELIPTLKSYRLPGLDLGGDLVYPDYGGRSLLNVPSSICRWLGVPTLSAEPLDPRYTQTLGSKYQNVILILIDALALETLITLVKSDSLPAWRKLAEKGILAPLTSIAPSTTASALTSLWTGAGVVAHGVVGYEMWMKEYGMVVNAILHAPMSFQGDAGSLRKAGFNPETFLESILLGTHLSNYGIQVNAFQHHSITHSGLSRMLLKDVSVNPFRTQSDLWVNARRVFENDPNSKKFIWIYWGEVDYLSHNYGPNDDRTISELINFSTSFEYLFLTN